ncbi:MAG: CBS domain-containing protein [Solirubrobacteraceae bacterium]
MATYQTDLGASLTHTTVAEAMHPGVVMCGADQPLPVVAAMMASHEIHTVVVQSRQGGEALSITDLDLVRAGLRGSPGETAGDLASNPMATVAPSTTLENATATMAILDVAHLLVRDPDADWPDGVISSFDIVSVLSGRDPRLTRTTRPGVAQPQGSATGLADTTVGQVMHHGVLTCLPGTPVHELAGQMADLRVHCIAVAGVAPRPDGDEHLMWGLVTDMDVIHAAHGARFATPAAELAATAPVALPEDATLERAAILMATHDVTHVVAVGSSGLPSGVVSTLDVIRILAAG